ncbi:tyrosine-type recombinase/integrase [Anaerohalosphaeraceae bacterium U12dextr]
MLDVFDVIINVTILTIYYYNRRNRMARKAKEEKLPGSLYQRNGRWWWSVRLPGEKTFRGRPLIPVGGLYAYRGDRAVAVEIAKAVLHQAIFKSSKDNSPKLDGTISGLIKSFLSYADNTYRKSDGSMTNYPTEIRETMQPLVEFCGVLPIEEFSPQKFKEFREYVAGLTRKNKKGKTKPRYCLSTLNKKVGIIKSMFRWAVEEGHVHPSTYHGLQAIKRLRPGQYGLIENAPVEPVAENIMLAVMPYTTQVLGDMMMVQYLTGMRSIELTGMRPCDIETEAGDGIWLYHVPQIYNKNARHGEKHKRIVPIGPKAQVILRKYLFREKNSFCFSPRDSERQRLAEKHKNRITPMNQGNKPKEDETLQQIGCKYDSASYGKAIKYAIRAANRDGQKIPEWTVYQLRHSAATNIAEELGLDVARAVLGHRSLKVTAIYAKEDIKKIAQKYKQIG